MTDTMPEQATENEDWGGEGDSSASYPEMPANPHNHVFTISMDGRGPMIVVRGNTPQEVNERFQALQDAGTTTLAASVYSHMKAEMQVAQGLGPVTPVPTAPAAPGMPMPQGNTPPPFGPNVSVPGAPGYQGVPGMPMPPAPPQGGGYGGGQQNSRGPKERPAWPQVYAIEVPFAAKDAFKAFREQYKDALRGKVAWAGGGKYWVEGSVAQSFAQYNPVPA
jgi:hypothetical protein